METAHNRFTWINSSGGPLLLLQEDLLQYWKGDEGDQLSDYQRACMVDDYLGFIDVGPGQGIVLEDEPLQTTWWSLSKENGGIMVRWVYANGESYIIKALTDLQDVLWEQNDFVLKVSKGSLVLFDAICPGDNTDCLDTGCRLSISLEVGSYSVTTAHYQPDEETSLIFHRLLRTEE